MSEAVQLLIYGSLLSAVAAVWTALNVKINRLAEQVEALRKENEELRKENGKIEDKWQAAEDRAKRFQYYSDWYRKAYRGLGGTGTPPPLEEAMDEATKPA